MADVLQRLGRYSSLPDSDTESPSEHLFMALAGLGRDFVLGDVLPEDIAEPYENARGGITHGSDDGCGIRPAALDHIFLPFFSARAPGEGSGIGRPVMADIMKSSGGWNWVSSEPGEGTEFRLAFPLSAKNKVS